MLRAWKMTSKEIRELLGISRAEFSKKYGIPVRTLENWDSGKREPPEWILKLLERVVREDKERRTKMTLKEWAIANGLEEQYKQFRAECDEASEYCEEQGYPSTGENYELMVENIKKNYPDLFED